MKIKVTVQIDENEEIVRVVQICPTAIELHSAKGEREFRNFLLNEASLRALCGTSYALDQIQKSEVSTDK